MKIAIPSYKRHFTLRDKTLSYLSKCIGIIEQNIYIFVANEDEYKIYKSTFRDKNYNIILGVETIGGQRNFITNFFEEDEFILTMDDDLKGLFYAADKKLHLFTDIPTLSSQAYQLMQQQKTKICGVYPVANHFFMSDKPSFDLKYIVGCFCFLIIDKCPDLSLELEDKEDYERSIKFYIKFGSLVRMNHVCVETKYYKEPGGMQMTRTKQRVEESAKFLVEKYPDYCEINTSKKNKEFTEIRLRDNAKHLKGGIF